MLLDTILRSIATYLAIAVGIVLLFMLLVSLWNRIIAKMGLRNIPRRPAQSALIVLGLTLSTIIVVSSLAIGDTLSYSVERQAVEVYGQIDEVLSPPILGTLAGLGIQLSDFDDGPPGAGNQLSEDQAALLEGGLTTVFALLEDGLPGISEDRYRELQQSIEQEPLIDGVAPSILFPIIIRNRTTGQGEPFGFIFGINDEYPAQFDMQTTDGSPVNIDDLKPGIGNIFEMAGVVVAVANESAQGLATQLGFEEFSISDLILTIAAAGTALDAPLGGVADAEPSPVEPANRPRAPDASEEAETEEDVDETPTVEPEPSGEESDTPDATATSVDDAEDTASETPTESPTAQPTEVPETEDDTADPAPSNPALDNTLDQLGLGGFDANSLDAEQLLAQLGSILGVDTAGALAFLEENFGITTESLGLDALVTNTAESTTNFATDIISTTAASVTGAINLNTLGEDIDTFLGQAGLELRRGEVYLSQVGAARLNAKRGDLLDIYLGPIPLPYRVAGIVDEAGPAAALVPVVVMNLDEAQRLLFMEDRINSVLVSNQGDELEGMALTAEVSERLRILSLNDDAIDNLMAVLREPTVSRAVHRAIDNYVEDDFFAPTQEETTAEDTGQDDAAAQAETDTGTGADTGTGNAVLDNLLESFRTTVGDTLGLSTVSRDLQALATAIDAEEMTPALAEDLRRSLSNRTIQIFLSTLERLPSAQQDEVNTAVSQLTELELLDPLNKQTVVTIAGVGGTAFSSAFSLFGFFSILAAILLIFMIFVMLAAERRSEMGMARAVGMQRRQLVQMFVTEGLVYDLLAALVGVGLGILISYAMVGFIGRLFTDVAGSFSNQIELDSIFRIRFNVLPTSMIIAYCLGVIFTFVVVVFASYRVSRLNIVAAIRDLPESNFTRRTTIVGQALRFIAGPALIGGGIYIMTLGETLEITQTQLAATMIVVGVAFLLGWILQWRETREAVRQRAVYSVIGIGLLALWALPWSRLIGGAGTIFEQNPATVLLSFALTAPLIILGAILTIVYNADVLVWPINFVLGGIGSLTPVLRTAIAYPLNNRFRTGMAMLLFAMIISTVVIMAIVIQATQLSTQPDTERNAGYEIQVNKTLLSFFYSINDLKGEIARLDDFPQADVASVAHITELELQAKLNDEPTTYNTSITGINSDYALQSSQIYGLQMRSEGYESDEAAWQAVAERDDVVIISPDLIRDPNPENQFDFDDDDDFDGERRRRFRRLRIEMALPEDDEVGILPDITLTLQNTTNDGVDVEKVVKVIGILKTDATLADGNIQVNDSVIETLTGQPVVTGAFYVKTAEGADVRFVANEIERAFVSSGLDTSIMAEAFAAGQAVTRGILQLFQGFMALGLLVGIAALGVISSRTVVERRQQVGMLRAIGYQPNMVALSFVLEASFIALCGIIIGTLTGITLGQNIVGEFFAAIADTTVPTPWQQIGVIVGLAYLASLLTTVLPAYQASRIYPAEALRYD
ncbi:MAG: FtsX-like permease family protein [Chloroflexota bacterium]